jgi:hypothetical protein
LSSGFDYAGLFILGAGLFVLAPEYVMTVLRKSKRGKNEE